MANASEYRASVKNAEPKGVSGFFSSVRTAIARRKIFVETLGELSDLTDRELNDMGLGRNDLKRVAHEAAQEYLA